jgi:cytochrome P450
MQEQPRAGELAPFDMAVLKSNGIGGRLQQWVIDNLRPVFALLRTVKPNLRVCGMVVVTRREDVEAVLADTEAFTVRFGKRVAALHPGAPVVFGLGTDGPQYAETLKQVSPAMGLEDIPRIAGILREHVEPQVATERAIDVGGLARLTQAKLGERYLGLAIGGGLADFAWWCLAVGNYGFGPQKPNSPAWDVGRGAGARIAATMQRSIALARAVPDRETVVGRLILAGLADDPIEAALTGLASALIPASTMAITHAVQVLLRWPEAMQAARAAALARDDERLGRCLLEAVRFRPIFPGPFRDCAIERTIAAGTSRKVRARAGDLVLPATQSAMFDGRRVTAPGVFNPDRSASDTLVFGFGRHWCFGYAVGTVQLVETLRPLLVRGFHQSRADRAATTYFGAFPERLRVQLA